MYVIFIIQFFSCIENIKTKERISSHVQVCVCVSHNAIHVLLN